MAAGGANAGMKTMGLARTIAVVGCALVIGWLTTALAVSLVTARHNPDTALAAWPWSAEGLAYEAASLVKPDVSSSTRDRARSLSLRALSREPGNVTALRTLGLLAAMEGKGARAEGLFRYAQTLSRRDTPTSLGLIEIFVQRNDIANALRQYDYAMTTSIEVRPTLIPILVAALSQGDVARRVAILMKRRPIWWGDFVDDMVLHAQSADGMFAVLKVLRLDPNKPVERDRLTAALSHIVDLGGIAQAQVLYADARSSGAAAMPLRDGGFDQRNDLAPFEWKLADLPDRQAIKESRDGAQGINALAFYGTAAGEAARQLLTLPQGRYLLSARIGDIPDEIASRPAIGLQCAARDGATLAKQSLPKSSQTGFAFEVPAQCAAQWLFLYAGSSIDPLATTPWIDSMSIRRMP